jgi:hypothetical protein
LSLRTLKQQKTRRLTFIDWMGFSQLKWWFHGSWATKHGDWKVICDNQVAFMRSWIWWFMLQC